MTHREKKMKAIFAAIALYLEQEAAQEEPVNMTSNWADMGKTMIMSNRNNFVQHTLYEVIRFLDVSQSSYL